MDVTAMVTVDRDLIVNVTLQEFMVVTVIVTVDAVGDQEFNLSCPISTRIILCLLFDFSI